MQIKNGKVELGPTKSQSRRSVEGVQVDSCRMGKRTGAKSYQLFFIEETMGVLCEKLLKARTKQGNKGGESFAQRQYSALHKEGSSSRSAYIPPPNPANQSWINQDLGSLRTHTSHASSRSSLPRCQHARTKCVLSTTTDTLASTESCSTSTNVLRSFKVCRAPMFGMRKHTGWASACLV